MSFQIASIVLYGPEDEPRVVRLNPGRLNVVTGSSRTGKSSLISIVDYCLGSTTCAVADGAIRETVRWFALLLTDGHRELFVARKAPERGYNSSNVMIVTSGETIPIPRLTELRQNTTVEAAVPAISRAFGIVDSIHEPLPGETRKPLAVNIKHALFFCLQAQDEINNRKFLFHQQGEPHIPQTIKDVLPYFLGAIADDHILKTNRLRQLRQTLRKMAREIEEAEAIRGEGTKTVNALMSEAVDQEMVEPPTSTDWESRIAILRELVEGPVVRQRQVQAEGRDYEKLLEERRELSAMLRRTERDMQEAQLLRTERASFLSDRAEHVGRLRVVGMFAGGAEGHGYACPLCASALPVEAANNELRSALGQLESKLEQVSFENPHLELLLSGLESRVQELRTKLLENRAQTDAISRSRKELAQYRDRLAREAHVRGRISLYLEKAPSTVAESGKLREAQVLLRRQIEALEDELSADNVQERIDSSLSRVSRELERYAIKLELENSEFPLRLDLSKLTIVADKPNGPVSMDRIGSAANWVGYHVVAHLALHTEFVTARRPVPRFLFLDQPSQAYFPADRDQSGKLEVGLDGRSVDEDREAVLMMFKLLRDFVALLDGQVQVILTEHADPSVEWFEDHVVARWRGDALIPQSWLTAVG